MKNWFEVDRSGLAAILNRKGKQFLLFELISNAWDETGVTAVDVSLFTAGHGLAQIEVSDDAPNGFQNLTHAWTLFASSAKKGNPEQRGRFNLGEKLVLAMAKEARITTTQGDVFFDEDGRHTGRTRTTTGSHIRVVVRMTQSEIADALSECRKLIPPQGIDTKLNGALLRSPKPHQKFTATLTTEKCDAEGLLSRTKRQTLVEVHKATTDCPASILEMGIPVCEIDGSWRFNVMQKVPLTLDRDEVLVSFRRELAAAAINNIHWELTPEETNTAWATEAIKSPDVTPEAVKSYVKQRFGEKAVVYDPSDREANHRAASEGYTVVTGSMLSGAAWDNVRSAQAILPAGQVTPSPKPYADTGGRELKDAEVTEQMQQVASYAKAFARNVLGANISVSFKAEVTWPYGATYGPGYLTFNVGRLGRAWFNLKTNQEKIDSLLIHEFGHHRESDHYSDKYHGALCDIGAKLARLIRAGVPFIDFKS